MWYAKGSCESGGLRPPHPPLSTKNCESGFCQLVIAHERSAKGASGQPGVAPPPGAMGRPAAPTGEYRLGIPRKVLP